MAFDREIAAMTIFCEASSEPHEGRVAVAATFFNRLKSGKFGKTIASVCLHRYQYSEWNADRADNANLLRAAEAAGNEPMIVDSLAAYDEAAGGSDPTDGATHYYAEYIQEPEWAKVAQFTIQIGRHKFFKNVP